MRDWRIACLWATSPADMEAAQRAGMKSCAVTYGYGQRQEMLKWSPDFWIDQFSELAE